MENTVNTNVLYSILLTIIIFIEIFKHDLLNGFSFIQSTNALPLTKTLHYI